MQIVVAWLGPFGLEASTHLRIQLEFAEVNPQISARDVLSETLERGCFQCSGWSGYVPVDLLLGATRPPPPRCSAASPGTRSRGAAPGRSPKEMKSSNRWKPKDKGSCDPPKTLRIQTTQKDNS